MNFATSGATSLSLSGWRPHGQVFQGSKLGSHPFIFQDYMGQVFCGQSPPQEEKDFPTQDHRTAAKIIVSITPEMMIYTIPNSLLE
ncbi:hypothetical protein DSO57_1018300 [Entomophthora muscae]|uniref:Uncharacterized protein n=1 Tax=Entomophthora muscae TaxID=34485 RepID=A0ACC2UQ11_9FUNG|nr:hypothetical protein DSO57_1018300 [Entomophthora muscae]